MFLSDLLWPGEPEALPMQFAHGAASLLVVQILGQTDAVPPVRGNLRLVDVETDDVREIFVDAAAQARYRDALTRHQQYWQSACKQVGATMTTVIAESLIDGWHLEPLVAVEAMEVSG